MAVLLNAIRAIGKQPSARHEDALGIDRRQAMPRDRCDGLLHEGVDGYVQGDKNAAIGLRRRCCYGALDVPKPVNVRDDRLDAEWPGGGFKRTDQQGPRGVVWIINHRNACNVGRDLFERLQHLADDRELVCGKAGHVAAGASEAFRVTPCDGLGATGGDNRN